MGAPLSMPVLHGDAVLLREWALTDAGLIQEVSSDPVIPGYTTVPRTPDLAAAEAFIARQHDRSRNAEGYSFAIADPSGTAALGQIGLWLYDLPRGSLSIGYWVAERHRGQGLAGRALDAVVAFARTIPDVFRIELQVEPHNVPSRRTAERAGFQQEGCLRAWLDVEGERRDVLAYALIVSRGRRRGVRSSSVVLAQHAPGHLRQDGSMGKKVKRRDLRDAFHDSEPVRVHRTLKKANAIEGYVVGLGRRWVVIHRVSDFRFDGWVVLRLDTVGRIEPLGAGDVVRRVLDRRGLRPEPLDLRLGSARGVIASGARRFPLVSVWREASHPNVYIVGWPVHMGKKRLSIFGVTPEADWEEEPYRRRLAAVTRVDLGTDYAAGLHEVAGFPPVA